MNDTKKKPQLVYEEMSEKSPKKVKKLEEKK